MSEAARQNAWISNLLVTAGLQDLNLDPSTAPDAEYVAALIRADFQNRDTWPELTQVLDSKPAEQEQIKQKLKTALDQVPTPPPSQW